MFDLKNIFQMQSQAKDIQKKLTGEEITVENHGISVKINGNQEVLNVTLNPELSQEDQEKFLKEALNDAIKKVQQLMAKMMMGM